MDCLMRQIENSKSLRKPVESWNTLIIGMVIINNNKLDPVTKREWEQKIFTENLLTFQNFLSNKCQILEAVKKKQYVLNKYKFETKVRVFDISRKHTKHE